MALRLLLASGSDIRRRLLQNAGLIFEVAAATIDETALRARLLASNIGPQDIAIAVAEAKAEKSSAGAGEALVIGCDQVLSHDGELLGKPENREAARAQLRRLRGDTHQLVSAVVIVEDGVPVWRHASEAQMVMRDFSDAWLDAYLQRNWHSVRHSVGGYKLEEEGARLFSRIDGDYFTILGLPLIELLGWLGRRGAIET